MGKRISKGKLVALRDRLETAERAERERSEARARDEQRRREAEEATRQIAAERAAAAQAGAKARRQGCTAATCPHPVEHYLRDAWLGGWRSAKDRRAA